MSTEENVCNNGVVKSPSVDFLLKQAYIAHKGKVKALESEIHKLKAELLQEKNSKVECTECKNLQSALKECKENYSKALKEQKQRIKLLEIHLSSLQGYPMYINKHENATKRNNSANDFPNICKKLKQNNLFNTKSAQSESEKYKDVSEDILNESIYAPETLNTDVICEFNETQKEQNPEVMETLDVPSVKFTLKSKVQNDKETSAKTVINTTTNSSISLLPNLDGLVNKVLSSTATKILHLTDKGITYPEKEITDILNEPVSSANLKVMSDPDNVEINDREKSQLIDIDETYLPLTQTEKENKDLVDLDDSMDDVTIIDEEISAKIKTEQHIKDDDDEVQVLLNNNESSFDRLPIKENKYKYKEECIRKKDQRRNLSGHCCKQCKHYYDQLDISNSEKVRRMKNCSRHRSLFDPPQTPEHYWELDFPNTEVCRERGYICGTQKRPLKTHRRHPLQMKQDKTTENSEM